jgi:cysteine desulfurase
MINLDRAALNSPFPRAEGTISRAMRLHRPASNVPGQEARSAVIEWRSAIADHLQRDHTDLSFFGSATAAVRFLADKLKGKGLVIYCSEVEHSCSRSVADTLLPVDSEGQIFGKLGGEDNVLIISAKNNETGIQPTGETRRIVSEFRDRGGICVVDATGADWRDPLVLEADYIFASAGKWNGLPGMGLLAGTKGIWDNQNTEGMGGLIAGSPNTIGIACLADAMSWISSSHGDGLKEKARNYNAAFDELAAELGWIKNGSGDFIANYCTGIPSDLFVAAAGEHELAISAGSACNSGFATGSHVIAAMHGDDRARCSVRFSWDRLTKETEISQAIAIVRKIDNELKALLPKGDR